MHVNKCFDGEVLINKINLRINLIIMRKIILKVITKPIESIVWMIR